MSKDTNPFKPGDRVRFAHNYYVVETVGEGTVVEVKGSWLLVEADKPWPTFAPGGYEGPHTTRLVMHYRGRWYGIDPQAGDARWVQKLQKEAIHE